MKFDFSRKEGAVWTSTRFLPHLTSSIRHLTSNVTHLFLWHCLPYLLFWNGTTFGKIEIPTTLLRLWVFEFLSGMKTMLKRQINIVIFLIHNYYVCNIESFLPPCVFYRSHKNAIVIKLCYILVEFTHYCHTILQAIVDFPLSPENYHLILKWQI